MPKCEYNTKIECFHSRTRCKRCGWNPDVSAARLAARMGRTLIVNDKEEKK